MFVSKKENLPNVNQEAPDVIPDGYKTPCDKVKFFPSPPALLKVSGPMAVFVDDVQFAPLLPDMDQEPLIEENRPPYFKVQPRFGTFNMEDILTNLDLPGDVPSSSFSESSDDEEDEEEEAEDITSTMMNHHHPSSQSLASLSSMEATRQERLAEACVKKVSPKKKTTYVKAPTPQRPTLQPRRNSFNASAA